MDEETKKKLRGLLPLTDKATVTFTPKAYLATGVAEMYLPRFTMRGLTRAEHMELSETFSSDYPEKDIVKGRMALVEKSTKWENLLGADGNEIPYSDDENGEAAFDALHHNVKLELIGKLYEISGMLAIDKVALVS
jgi:hypothetical protein